MKTVWIMFSLLVIFVFVCSSAGAERPSHELVMPYSTQWRDLDYGFVDLLSLLRCDSARWKDHSTTDSPVTVGGFAMAYDALLSRTVLFNGIDSGGLHLLSETWEWDGADWSRVATEGPAGRLSEAMVYDASRQAVLLVGGQGADATGSITMMYSDSWIWDGSAWTELHPVHHPTARAGHTLAFDSVHGEVVLFGGDMTNSFDMTGPYLNDTWVWDGVDWEIKSPTDSPSARFRQAMAYDASRGKVVLFGGHGMDGPLADTWEWDGLDWTQIATVHQPDNRRGHGMTYDSRRKKVVLYGGELGYEYSSETWEYDGADWTRIEIVNPPETDSLALTYDAARGETVLFTGEQPDATFVYDGEPSCPE